MPTVSEAFKTYHDFASANLEEIYGKRLESATKLILNHVESGILINDGSGKFSFEPLPRIAQLAPTFGTIATHLDGDGYPDLVLAQNFYHAQRESGRFNGSVSLALLGNGDGSYRPLAPTVSGVTLAGDSRSATIVDFTGNHRPDLLIARNSASPQLYLNNAAGSFYKIRLQSKSGSNRHGIGSRITVEYKDGKQESLDVLAGQGYLSQSIPEVFVSYAANNPIVRAQVLWQDGSSSQHQAPAESKHSSAWVIEQSR